jgi:ubiquinone/menaquinone biosynthesis C-methylase UbiE
MKHTLLQRSTALLLGASLAFAAATTRAASGTTRIEDADATRKAHSPPKGFKTKKDYVLAELDLKPGDVVVDIGAGDGIWAEPMAKIVGEKGVIHAGEVDQKKVDGMKKKFADLPQLRPYLCPTDSPGLPERSCDMAFFSESYHHLGTNAQIAYLKGLRSVLKPTGRVVIIERYTEIGVGQGEHGTRLSRLVREAEEAGWVTVRTQLIPETYHYIAILAQKELFPPEPKRDQGKNKKKAPPKKQ